MIGRVVIAIVLSTIVVRRRGSIPLSCIVYLTKIY